MENLMTCLAWWLGMKVKVTYTIQVSLMSKLNVLVWGMFTEVCYFERLGIEAQLRIVEN